MVRRAKNMSHLMSIWFDSVINQVVVLTYFFMYTTIHIFIKNVKKETKFR